MARILLLLLWIWPALLQAQPIKIGILTDLSGAMASWGRQSRLGAEIARDEIVKSGGALELIFGDDQLNAKNAVSEFRKLIEFDQVDTVYCEFTPPTVAVAPIAKTKQVLMVYSAAAASPLELSPYLFKSYMNYVDGCRTIGEFWRSQGIKRAGILRLNFESGDLCAQGLKQAYPELIESNYNHDDDLVAQVMLLKSHGVEAVMNVAFEPDLLRMYQALKRLNWRPLVGTQNDAVADAAIERFPGLLEKTTVFGLPQLSEAFLSKVKAHDPENTLASISAAGLAYLHIKQLYAAISGCPKKAVACISEKLSAAPADPEFGFGRWVKRVADFRVSLRTWRAGRAVEQPR
ncbi:MAG: ABC transporter substrate-binding protein [Oligoflexia bacterium]|nr:ABC transporter substrate-binding protein [Oligoflexia bacterium]